jgi:SAM-dependent methyltransferase
LEIPDRKRHSPARRLAQLRYAWDRHGLIGFVWLVAYNIAHHIRSLNRRGQVTQQVDPFDQKYGAETGGYRDIRSLDVITLPAARYAGRYEPSSAELVRSELEKLQIDPERFTFVDFGSGKGRVLLIAAGFPFKEVVGVEFSRELHEIAKRNIAQIPPECSRAGALRSIHGDAAAFELPKSDLVCYFYNPFDPPVITAVADHLAAHHRDFGHRIIIIYVDPRHREAFERTQKFVALDETPGTLILTTVQEPADQTIGSSEESG